MPRNTASYSRSRCSNGTSAADLDPEPKLHAHAFHDLAARLDHLLFELEGRDAEGQQSADARIAIVDHGLARRCAPGCRRSPVPRDLRRRSRRACRSRARPTCRAASPDCSASSVMYFSIEPIVTAPRPSLSVQAPSHSRSCGQMRPHTSGSELVLMRQLGGLEQLALADAASASSGCSCGPGTSIHRTDCRKTGSGPACCAAASASYGV